MTQSVTTARNEGTGNGSTTAFSFTFPISAETDISVYEDEVLQALTTDYTVSVTTYPGAGTVNFVSAPASGVDVLLVQNVPFTQPVNYTTFGAFTTLTNETALDRATMNIVRINDKLDSFFGIDDTMKASDKPTMIISEEAAARASKVLAFNAAGTALTADTEIGNNQGDWATATSYVARDIILDTTNSNVYICNTAHTSSGSEPISSNADVAKWDLILNTAAATVAETNAAASAVAALASQVAAASSATSASSSSTSATSSASTATTQASAASTSATAAAASYDNFDDRWLGDKASDPSVDNDGNSLLDGAAYFNTTDNVLMVYDLGGTTWNRTTPTSADQTKINTVSGIASNVTTVAGISGNVTTVAGVSSNVTTVAGISSDVTAVAADATDIGAVAAKATEIGRLGTADAVADMAILGTADVVTDMNVLATADVVTDMNTLGTADVVADMNVLGTADVVTDMNTLGTADVVADMNTLGTADVVADMNALAAIDTEIGRLGTADAVADMAILGTADVVTDLNTLGTADVVTDMNTLGTAGNVTAMATCATNVADINRYSDEYTISASAPGSPSEGDLWYDSSANVLKVHNGSSFVAVTSATAGITDVVDDTTPQLGGNLDLQTYTLSNVSLANGGFYSNPNTITADATVTTASTKNMFLMGQISVNDTYTWTIAGDGVLQII